MRKFVFWSRVVASNILIIIFCGTFAHAQTTNSSLISEDIIKTAVEFLSSDSLKGRLTGTQSALQAANYIAEEFRKAGLKPLDSAEGFYFSFFALDGKVTGYNIVGVLPGQETRKEQIIYSAHYDHVGTISTNPYPDFRSKKIISGADTIFNGANDNASGTAALISLAHYYGSLKNNKRSIIFVAFSGEELGLVGSEALASSLANPSSIVSLINLEMLGRGEYPFITGGDLGNVQLILNRELAKIDRKNYGKHFFKREPFREHRLFTRSDNYPFALLRIPAYTIMATSDIDPYYHTVDDEAETLDYGKITRIVSAIILSMNPIINERAKPWRINAANYNISENGY
jgi:Zn-dependent M28 family amino/carboxypeptidase